MWQRDNVHHYLYIHIYVLLYIVRFSSTLIFFTELMLVFAALFMISVVVMTTLQLLSNRNKSIIITKSKNELESNVSSKASSSKQPNYYY